MAQLNQDLQDAMKRKYHAENEERIRDVSKANFWLSIIILIQHAIMMSLIFKLFTA